MRWAPCSASGISPHLTLPTAPQTKYCLQTFIWHSWVELSWRVCWLFFGLLALHRSNIVPLCISNVFSVCRWTDEWRWGIGVNTVKGPPLLTEHTYRHPSTCPARCHTSQQLADGFILSPALSPLLFSVTFLPPSVFHLLHPPKWLMLIWSRLPQLLHFLPSVVFWLLHKQIWQSRSGIQKKNKNKTKIKSWSSWCSQPTYCSI